MFDILYKIRNIKQSIFQRYQTSMKNDKRCISLDIIYFSNMPKFFISSIENLDNFIKSYTPLLFLHMHLITNNNHMDSFDICYTFSTVCITAFFVKYNKSEGYSNTSKLLGGLMRSLISLVIYTIGLQLRIIKLCAQQFWIIFS